eukprot:scaffold3042_cov127-Skeletonema_dohrnii-CCMP3373.AAC.9
MTIDKRQLLTSSSRKRPLMLGDGMDKEETREGFCAIKIAVFEFQFLRTPLRRCEPFPRHFKSSARYNCPTAHAIALKSSDLPKRKAKTRQRPNAKNASLQDFRGQPPQVL